MGGSKAPKTPKAPDYAALAQQQAGIDAAAAAEQTKANRPTQTNAYGTLEWTRNPDGTWLQKETAAPEFENARRAVMGRGNVLAASIAKQGDFKGANQVKWSPEANKEYADAIYKSTMDRAAPKQERDLASQRNQLRQQGFVPGSEAYSRAMNDTLVAQGDVNTQAAQQATIAGADKYRQDYSAQLKGQDQNYSQDLQNYQMPWDLVGASQSLGQSYRPSFAGFGTATGYAPADMAGAAQSQYQTKMGDYNARQQKAGK